MLFKKNNETSRRDYEREDRLLAKEKAKRAKARKAQERKKVVPEKSNTLIGRGINLKNPTRLIKIYIPDHHRARGTWICGTTGSGKTRLMEGIIEQDIAKGYNCCIFDPKGDGALVSKVVHQAQKCGREQDLMLVTPIFPELSALIDPLASYFMPEELVAHICSGVTVGKEPYFWNVSYRTASVIVQALILLKKSSGQHPTFNLKEVEGYLGYGQLQNLQHRLESLDAAYNAEDVIGKLKQILATPPDYFAKIGSSLQVAVDELTTGSVGGIIGKADENRFLKRLETGKGVIMIVQLGSMLSQRAGYTAGKVILSMIQTYAGRVYASGKKMDPPLCLHIDEAQSVIWPGLSETLAKAGSANVYTAIYNQSVSQFYEIVGKDNANSILDNCNNKVFLLVPDALTADYISIHLGEKKTWQQIMSLGGGLTVRKVEEARVKPSDIMALQPRMFYMKSYMGIFKGETIDVFDSPTQVVFPTPSTIRKLA